MPLWVSPAVAPLSRAGGYLCKILALYLHLYGLSRQDAAYIMDTFPIVRREDDKEFGVYRTKEMV